MRIKVTHRGVSPLAGGYLRQPRLCVESTLAVPFGKRGLNFVILFWVGRQGVHRRFHQQFLAITIFIFIRLKNSLAKYPSHSLIFFILFITHSPITSPIRRFTRGILGSRTALQYQRYPRGFYPNRSCAHESDEDETKSAAGSLGGLAHDSQMQNHDGATAFAIRWRRIARESAAHTESLTVSRSLAVFLVLHC